MRILHYKQVLSIIFLWMLVNLPISAKKAPKKSIKDTLRAALERRASLKYLNAAARAAETIKDSAKTGEAVLNKYVNEMKERPKGLMDPDQLAKEAVKGFLQSDKAGTRDISLRSNQGFGSEGNFQPAGFTLTQKFHPDGEKKQDQSEETQGSGAFTYPMGLGPILYSNCFALNYSKHNPCFNSKKHFLLKGQCNEMLDAANFIGVGFDGRGFYSAQSRKTSLVQRKCTAGSYFLDAQVPDVMNCFGIYDTKVETKTFQSADEYMTYVQDKAGVAKTKAMFKAESDKISKMTSAGGNLGGVGAVIGGIGGAIFAGPAGALIGAAAGASLGETASGGYGSGEGNSKTDKSVESETSHKQSFKSSRNSGRTESFFATMTVNMVLFEIALDEVTPNDLSFAMIRDYAALPSSYLSAGADAKYQKFIVRWGTHYVTSAQMGGKLSITKTSKADKKMSSSEFSEVAETEFKSMFANLQSSYSQKSYGASFLGLGFKKKNAEQEATYKTGGEGESTHKAKSKLDDSMKQSQFTHTMVAAEGGDPQIAQAIVDFYTPSFKDTFSNWLSSINDYPKPILFTLRGLDDLLNLNMRSLFPVGQEFDFGCGGKKNASQKLHVEAGTQKRYYYVQVTQDIGNETEILKTKVYCKYTDEKDFQNSFDRRHLSLEKAIAIYLTEGPFPTSSFDVKGGKHGCENSGMNNIDNNTVHPLWSEMQNKEFKVIFDIPADIPGIANKDDEFIVKKIYNRWFANRPNEKTMHIYQGCLISYFNKSSIKKICVKNLILTYDEDSGFLEVTRQDFNYSLLINRELPKWLEGAVVARAKVMSLTELTKGNKLVGEKLAFPCNYKWRNSHRIDPTSNATCIHFSAATEGHIYVIFSSVPKEINSWYYIYISYNGVAFYKGMKLEKSEYGEGMGTLGDENLYSSYFTCIIQSEQSSGTVSLQYGKADPDSEIGQVHAAHTFKGNGKKQTISYYTFGSGSSDISFHDVRITKKLPKLKCPKEGYVLSADYCVLDCHDECNGCTTAQDNTQCDACKNAKVVDGNKLTCLNKCPVGYTSSTTDANVCVKCAAGTFKNITGNQPCTQCEGGSFASRQGSVKCTPCGIGKICPNAGCKVCTNCTPGTYSSSPGQRACLSCVNGSHIDIEGASECKKCRPGHYADREGLDKCLECRNGTFTNVVGATYCDKCPYKMVSGMGARSCNNSCLRGFFSTKQGEPCRKCERGTFSESGGSLSCQRCQVGHYQDAEGQSACKKCEPGTYQNSTGATECRKCSPGSCQDKAGKTQCKKCKPGTYQAEEGGKKCTPCARGSATSEEGSEVCLKCGVGYYASQEGQTNCSMCLQGTFSNKTGQAKCTKCKIGYYQTGFGSSECIPCPEGKYTYEKEGNKKCNPCPKGQYNDETGQAKCKLCPKGRYQNVTGQTECKRCMAGFYQPEQGKSSCDQCEPGKWTPTSGYQICSKCPDTLYQHMIGDQMCNLTEKVKDNKLKYSYF